MTRRSPVGPYLIEIQQLELGIGDDGLCRAGRNETELSLGSRERSLDLQPTPEASRVGEEGANLLGSEAAAPEFRVEDMRADRSLVHEPRPPPAYIRGLGLGERGDVPRRGTAPRNERG